MTSTPPVGPLPLTTHMPDLGALELLVTVARRGSLAAAAAERGISQPAASSRVRHLEQLLGLPLVLRGATGSALTEQGQLVVRWATDLLASAAVMDAALTSLRQAYQARLRLAGSSTIARFLLPGWLAAGEPGVEVEVCSGNSEQVMDRVLHGGAALGLVEGPALRHGLTARAIGADQLLVVVGAEHAWAERRTPVGAAELAGTPLLQRERGSGTRAWLETELAACRPVPPCWEGSGSAELLDRVAQGQAPAVLSEHVVRAGLQAGSLLRVPTTGLRLRRPLRAVWPFGQPLCASSREVLRAIASGSASASRRAAAPA